jgi:hypothetical protein
MIEHAQRSQCLQISVFALVFLFSCHQGLELIVDKTTGKVTVKAGTISYWPLPGRSGGQEVYSETP